MSTPVNSDSNFRDAFLEGAARLFFTVAYADHVENDAPDLPRPGGGDDWYDYAPEATPPNAYALAGEMWASYEAANKTNMYALAARAGRADGGTCETEVDAEEFGTALAWMYMGAGVSWFDDHAEFELEIPYGEVGSHSFDPSAYAPDDD